MSEPQEYKLLRDRTIRKLREYVVSIGDVPLSDAAVHWHPVGYMKHETVGRILVIPQSRIDAGEDLPLEYDLPFATGAHLSEWAEMSDEERLLRLCIEAWRIVGRGEVAPEKVHQALMSIPEYRRDVSGRGMFERNSRFFIIRTPRG